MNRSELSLIGKGLSALTTWAKKRQKISRARQTIEKTEMDIEKIESKANAEIQIIREKSAARMRSKLLILEELKLKYKIKYGGK